MDGYFFARGRLYRSDGHYWTLGLRVASPSFKSAVASLDAFSSACTLFTFHFLLEEIRDLPARAVEYFPLEEGFLSKPLPDPLRLFIKEGFPPNE